MLDPIKTGAPRTLLVGNCPELSFWTKSILEQLGWCPKGFKTGGADEDLLSSYK